MQSSVILGSTAIVTTRPWLNNRVIPSNAKKSKAENRVVHPIFKELAELSTHEFWTKIFSDGAKGKLPKGFSFRDGNIFFKKGAKVTSCDIGTIPTLAYSRCINFFNAHGLLSPDDHALIRQEHERILTTRIRQEEISWKDIKGKKLRESYIDEYIKVLGKNFDLCVTENKWLRSVVFNAYFTGKLNSSRVVFEKGEIVQIKGIIFDPVTRIISIDPSFQPRTVKSRSETPNVKIDYLKLWEKTLDRVEAIQASERTSLSIIGISATPVSVSTAGYTEIYTTLSDFQT